MDKLEKDIFLKKFKIKSSTFKNSGLVWEELNDIYIDYFNKKREYENSAKPIYELLISSENVSSVKFRLKDPEHLIEKIIRKRLEGSKVKLNKFNYEKIITDLIGIRILHLFKEDWIKIHNFIRTNFNLTKNKPIAYIRSGDNEKYTDFLKRYGCMIKKHKNGYRSVHYIINTALTKKSKVMEIQVRTIFEEGWSEVDHKVRYPYNTKNVLLGQYMGLLNRIAGSADEMSSFINSLINYQNEIINKNKIISDKKIKPGKVRKFDIDKDFKYLPKYLKENIYINNPIQEIINLNK